MFNPTIYITSQSGSDDDSVTRNREVYNECRKSSANRRGDWFMGRVFRAGRGLRERSAAFLHGRLRNSRRSLPPFSGRSPPGGFCLSPSFRRLGTFKAQQASLTTCAFPHPQRFPELQRALDESQRAFEDTKRRHVCCLRLFGRLTVKIQKHLCYNIISAGKYILSPDGLGHEF